MSHCLILQHDAAFGPGRVVPIFRDFGIPSHTVRLDQGHPIPDDFDEAHPRAAGRAAAAHRPAAAHERADFLAREVEMLKPLIREDFPILGFGLGALLARGCRRKRCADDQRGIGGCRVYGWDRLTLPFPGGTDPILFGLRWDANVFLAQGHVRSSQAPAAAGV